MYTVVVHLTGIGRPDQFRFQLRNREAAQRFVERISQYGFWVKGKPMTLIPPARISLVELVRINSRSTSTMRIDGALRKMRRGAVR